MKETSVDSEALKFHLCSLQRNVIELLDKISDLMYQTSVAVGSEEASQKYIKFQQEIVQASRNVQDLKLKLAIVAPMKAGKSTIINAIIGQPLLPSRNAAMTMLPTEILLNAKLKKPVLILSPEFLLTFEQMWLAVRHSITESGIESILKQTNHYPHLAKLIQTIFVQEKFPIPAKISGCKAVNETLTYLNDIIRLCHLITPQIEPLESLTDFPRLHTPFWRTSYKFDQPEQLGNLVIVDTPGPNEAGTHRLAAVVEQQLQKSSMVLIVLDFTQLKTQASEQIKEEVQKAIELRGKENLYVLINKVDQRREGDMTPEQVRRFVASELGIGDTDDTERVFEISARFAFAAANFFMELQQHPRIAVTKLQTARPLAQEVFGVDWEEDLEDATVEELQQKAQKLWKKSSFAPFLETAIDALIERAAPRCIKSALNISNSRLLQLCNEARSLPSSVTKPAKRFRSEARSIAEDLILIDLWRKSLIELEEIKPLLHEQIREDLEIIKNKTLVNLEKYFFYEEYQRASVITRYATSFFVKLNNLERFPQAHIVQRFGRWLLSRLQFAPTGVVYLKTPEEAEEFYDYALNYTKEKLDNLIEVSSQDISIKLEQKRQELQNRLEEEISKFSKKVRDYFQNNFSSNSSSPNIFIKPDGIKIWGSLFRTEIESVEKYQKKQVKAWGRLSLIKMNRTTAVKYAVFLSELSEQVNQLIEQRGERLKQRANEYLEQEFKIDMENLFKELIQL
ncbi:dynamin family protein [Microcoleus sp. AT9_B5]